MQWEPVDAREAGQDETCMSMNSTEEDVLRQNETLSQHRPFALGVAIFQNATSRLCQ